ARWFAANGWAYPVVGAPVSGVAGVQQFFEGLGVSKPPPVALYPQEFRCTLADGEPVKGQVTLRTDVKKWVYAQVDSDAPWLKVTTPNVTGPQVAQIGFEVDPRKLRANGTHEAQLQVVANGGQRLSLPVRVLVDRPESSAFLRLLQPV